MVNVLPKEVTAIYKTFAKANPAAHGIITGNPRGQLIEKVTKAYRELNMPLPKNLSKQITTQLGKYRGICMSQYGPKLKGLV